MSHAYLDSRIADRIINKLLIPIFSLDKQRDIFFTSKRKTGIRSSINWKNNIKQNLKDCDVFIALITTNFKQSEMCLGEIGAAWVLNKKIYSLILPPINHQNFSEVISELQADMLMKKEDVDMFIESLATDLKKLYDIEKTVESLDDYVMKFHKSLRSYKRKNPHLFIEFQHDQADPDERLNRKKQLSNRIHKDVNEQIIKLSQEKYPDDFSMQEYEVNEQKEALAELEKLITKYRSNSQISGILSRAMDIYPDDYTMQVYEANEQIAAFNRL